MWKFQQNNFLTIGMNLECKNQNKNMEKKFKQQKLEVWRHENKRAWAEATDCRE